VNINLLPFTVLWVMLAVAVIGLILCRRVDRPGARMIGSTSLKARLVSSHSRPPLRRSWKPLTVGARPLRSSRFCTGSPWPLATFTRIGSTL
jgi:hypothetical protein